MDIIGKIRWFLIPFIIIFAVIVMAGGAIIKSIIDFFVKNGKEIILFIGTAAFVVPIIFTAATDWEIPGFLIFYDFIFGFVVLFMMIGAADRKNYEQEGGYNRCHGYQNTPSTTKTYGYNNTFFTPFNSEKERNGGFTDKEVALKKQLIRKKLEKKKLLEISEKIKDEQVVG